MTDFLSVWTILGVILVTGAIWLAIKLKHPGESGSQATKSSVSSSGSSWWKKGGIALFVLGIAVILLPFIPINGTEGETPTKPEDQEWKFSWYEHENSSNSAGKLDSETGMPADVTLWSESSLDFKVTRYRNHYIWFTWDKVSGGKYRYREDERNTGTWTITHQEPGLLIGNYFRNGGSGTIKLYRVD